MNKEFLHMQKLAGLITEGEYKAELNEDENISPNETKINNYFDYYVANKDTEVKDIDNNKKISVPRGTVIHAVGGGYWKSVDGKIKTGIGSLKGNQDFDVFNNPTWPNTIDLVDDIESWGRDTLELIQKDPKNIQKIIDARTKIIDAIRKMIK